ncbi:DUF4236 domain-containing protein [Paenibacillus protaetiae]|nr:DUF4236 domain-containing protein [Paenibacillus protaetiae]
MIKSIHKECDQTIDWEDLKQTAPPFQPGDKGPKEWAAQRELDRFKPTMFQRWFKLDEKKRVKLHEKVIQAALEDQEDYASWNNMITTAMQITAGNPDEFLKVIEEMSPLDDLSDFGSGFEFFIENASTLEVDFDVRSENVIPKETKSLTKTGKVSVKPMTKTAYFDLYQDYVCSCVLRIARDMFAILPFEQVYIHAMDHQINSSTGHMEHVTILSVKIDRPTLNKLHFDAIDCSDSMQNFTHNMKFVKTTGFKPVERLVIE